MTDEEFDKEKDFKNWRKYSLKNWLKLIWSLIYGALSGL